MVARVGSLLMPIPLCVHYIYKVPGTVTPRANPDVHLDHLGAQQVVITLVQERARYTGA